MLSNPLNRVTLGNKTLNDFRFPIGPQDIDPPAGTGIFPGHESRLLFQHQSNMRLRRPGSSQLSCHNQTDPLARRWSIADSRKAAGAGLASGECGPAPKNESGRPVQRGTPVGRAPVPRGNCSTSSSASARPARRSGRWAIRCGIRLARKGGCSRRSWPRSPSSSAS